MFEMQHTLPHLNSEDIFIAESCINVIIFLLISINSKWYCLFVLDECIWE